LKTHGREITNRKRHQEQVMPEQPFEPNVVITYKPVKGRTKKIEVMGELGSDGKLLPCQLYTKDEWGSSSSADWEYSADFGLTFQGGHPVGEVSFTYVTITQIRRRHKAEEKRLILGALKRNGWNVGATARALEVQPTGLRAMIRAHGIDGQLKENGREAGRPRKVKK
jgi:Bacterial regulatory protein, Fis family